MIELKNVYKTLGDFHLNDINLKIRDNEYFVILGPTGTGKTVILETIAGMYKPDKGRILFNNRDITKMYPEQRNIGFVYQDYVLFPHLNVMENILFGLKLRKVSDDIMTEKLEEVSALLGIGHLLARFPCTLSGGEQQRVAIARILVLSPDVLLLDEPLSALDPRTKENFQRELKRIHNMFKTTTIHITHDFNEALILADRIGIMKDGQIIQTGTPEEVFYKPRTRFIADFVGMENVFSGEVKETEGHRFVKIDDVLLKAVTEQNGKVHVTIRPEEIILAKDNVKTAAQNMLECRIEEIIPQGMLTKVRLDAGIPLTALVTEYSLKEMDFHTNQHVYAAFKAASVHVFKQRNI